MSFAALNHIALAQMNVCVGDMANNAALIIDRIHSARKQQADMVVFPELVVSGYPPEDLLLRPDFHQQTQLALTKILKASTDIKVVLGYSERIDEHLYNVCSLLHNGQIMHSYHKRSLPNYGVFDEKRYFTKGSNSSLCDIGNKRIALSICEDLWTPEHSAEAARESADLLININASPYHFNKANIREALICTRARENLLDILYVNMVGGQDELVFDGNSLFVNKQGEIVYRAPRFCDGLFLFALADKNKPSSISPPDDDEKDIYHAIVTGVRDYAVKNHFCGAVIGLSGGIDSALTLAIAVDALGAENIEVLIMPSRYTAAMSNSDADEMAKIVGVKAHVYSIEKPFEAFLHLLESAFSDTPVDATEENIQARCRGILLMAISNKSGKLLLTTGNKSEMAVGYATLYGDMAGGFAPLKDVSKTLVYKLSAWRNTQGRVIPQRIIDRPPSAELRPNQKDADSLPPYDILDAILERYIELDQSPRDIIAAGFDAEVIRDVVRLVDRNEYKRRQAAPGVRITARAFGRDRRYPVTSRYKESN